MLKVVSKFSFRILAKLQLPNLGQTSGSKCWPIFSHKIWTKLQPENLEQTSASNLNWTSTSKSWPNLRLDIFHNLQHQNLSTRLLPTHRSPKRPKTVLSSGRVREMTWWSQTNFFRDHLYHCYGFYLDRLDTPSSFSLISENQLIFRFWAIFDTKFSRYHQFEGTSSLSSVFVQLNSGSIMKKL